MPLPRGLRFACLYYAATDATLVDAFVLGAVFDLANLKQQVLSVRYPLRGAAGLSLEMQDFQRAIANLRLTANEVLAHIESIKEGERKSVPLQCCPREYKELKAILRKAKLEQELNQLKDEILSLAKRARKTVKMYVPDRPGP
jgi:hypothetical protein